MTTKPEEHARRRAAYDAKDCDPCAALELGIQAATFTAWRVKQGLPSKWTKQTRCPTRQAPIQQESDLRAELARTRRQLADARAKLLEISRLAAAPLAVPKAGFHPATTRADLAASTVQDAKDRLTRAEARANPFRNQSAPSSGPVQDILAPPPGGAAPGLWRQITRKDAKGHPVITLPKTARRPAPAPPSEE